MKKLALSCNLFAIICSHKNYQPNNLFHTNNGTYGAITFPFDGSLKRLLANNHLKC